MPKLAIRGNGPSEITLTDEQMKLIPPDSIGKWSWRKTGNWGDSIIRAAYSTGGSNSSVYLQKLLFDLHGDNSLMVYYPDGLARHDTARIIKRNSVEARKRFRNGLHKDLSVRKAEQESRQYGLSLSLHGCTARESKKSAPPSHNRCEGFDGACVHYDDCLAKVVAERPAWRGWTSDGAGFVEAQRCQEL